MGAGGLRSWQSSRLSSPVSGVGGLQAPPRGCRRNRAFLFLSLYTCLVQLLELHCSECRLRQERETDECLCVCMYIHVHHIHKHMHTHIHTCTNVHMHTYTYYIYNTWKCTLDCTT